LTEKKTDQLLLFSLDVVNHLVQPLFFYLLNTVKIPLEVSSIMYASANFL